MQANHQRSGSGLDGGGVGGGVDQDVDEGGSPGGGLDDLTGFFPELLTPFAPTSPSELLIAVVFATPSILFILYSGQLDFLVPPDQKPPTQILSFRQFFITKRVRNFVLTAIITLGLKVNSAKV